MKTKIHAAHGDPEPNQNADPPSKSSRVAFPVVDSRGWDDFRRNG